MLVRFKTILVTTDFSELGDHAIAHAFRMAADHGSAVVLCHVIETVVTPAPLYAQYYPADLITPEIRERAEEDATKALLERVPEDPTLKSVAHSVRLAHGAPGREIVAVAESEHADLIVISTHGRTGLKHWLLGSTAEQVIRHAHCAVLVVR